MVLNISNLEGKTGLESWKFFTKVVHLKVAKLTLISKKPVQIRMSNGLFCKYKTPFDTLDISRMPLTGHDSLYGLFSGEISKSIIAKNWITDAKSTKQMFKSTVSTVDLENLHAKSATDMAEMFAGCKNITSVNMRNTICPNVRTTYGMFQGCSYVESIDMSNSTFDSLIDMRFMFADCRSLMDLNLLGLNTSKVETMRCTFRNCFNLTNIDLSSFDTRNVKNMESMFETCSGLTELDLSGFDTSNLEVATMMFKGCSKLTKLDLSHFKFNNVTEMQSMFEECTQLEEIDLSGLELTAAIENGLRSHRNKAISTSDMFWNCHRLKTMILPKHERTRQIILRALKDCNIQCETV